MAYSQENGYVPTTISAIMLQFMGYVNSQFGTAYTEETFVGTNLYKFFYAQAQLFQKNEVQTSEIFLKLQNYFDQINARISRPVITNPGIVEKLLEEGYVASLKPMIEADAGKINIAVDIDDGVHAEGTVTITSYANLVSGTDDVVTVAGTAFTAQSGATTPGTGTFQASTSNAATASSLATQINAHATASLSVRAQAVGDVVKIIALHGGTAGNAITLAYTDNDTNVGATISGATLADGEDNPDYADARLELCTLISQITAAGAVTQGTESETIVLSNGQSFDFKYHLPNRIETQLRLTVTVSENNQVVIGDPDETKLKLLANIQARYRLGKNFEPQRYFSVVDAPWAASVLLEWAAKSDSPSWSSAIYDAAFDDLFDISLENIELVEA